MVAGPQVRVWIEGCYPRGLIEAAVMMLPQWLDAFRPFINRDPRQVLIEFRVKNDDSIKTLQQDLADNIRVLLTFGDFAQGLPVDKLED